jgi:hypothetical protein
MYLYLAWGPVRDKVYSYFYHVLRPGRHKSSYFYLALGPGEIKVITFISFGAQAN